MKLSMKHLARLSGVFYLIIIISGLYSGIIIREGLIDLSNPAQTLQQIIENQRTYKLGFLSDTIMVIADVVISILFYFLLVKVNQLVAVLATVFRLIQSAILGANLINLFQPIILIHNFELMSDDQILNLQQGLINQLQVFDYGYLISGVFFAINCLLMGYLVYKSELFHSFLGIMLTFAGVGYLFNCLAHFIWPSYIEVSEVFMLFTAVISELSFCLYLLIKGIKTSAQKELQLS